MEADEEAGRDPEEGAVIGSWQLVDSSVSAAASLGVGSW